MYIILKVQNQNEISIIKSSLDLEIEKTVFATFERKIQIEKMLDKLNNTSTSIPYEDQKFYTLITSRHDNYGFLILIILLDNCSTYLEMFHIEIKQYLNQKFNIIEDYESIDLDWKKSCILYLPLFIKHYKSVLSEIIFSSLLGSRFVYKNISEIEIEEIERFKYCFEIIDTKEKQKADSAKSFIIEQVNGQITCNLEVFNEACVNLAETLVEIEDPIELKSIIRDFVLEVNKELNIARRMLNKAVGDFYSNYQFYKYVSSSNKSEILHYHLNLNEDISLKEKEVLNLTIKLVKEK